MLAVILTVAVVVAVVAVVIESERSSERVAGIREARLNEFCDRDAKWHAGHAARVEARAKQQELFLREYRKAR